MLTENYDAGGAALEVGYESTTQFSREYSRLFGQPPMRYVRTLRQLSGADDLRSAVWRETNLISRRWIGIDHVWFNPEQTRTTSVAIDALLKKVGAQLWTQHDFDENAKLKKAPNFYE
jgi:hypothetical protein